MKVLTFLWLTSGLVCLFSYTTFAASCQSPTIRKELHDLTSQDWEVYLDTVHKAATVNHPTYGRPIWEVAASLHNQMGTPAHGSCLFFPWHRAFVAWVEKELQNINPKFAFFYWDSSLEWDNAGESIIWDYLGRDTSQGPLANITLSLYGNAYLARGYNRKSFGSLPGPEVFDGLYQNSLTKNGYEYWASIAELYHGILHNIVGGGQYAMSSMYSPLDPVFYAHHSDYDQKWSVVSAAWNRAGYGDNYQIGGKQINDQGNCTMDTILPSFNVKIRDALDLSRLCVRYAAPGEKVSSDDSSNTTSTAVATSTSLTFTTTNPSAVATTVSLTSTVLTSTTSTVPVMTSTSIPQSSSSSLSTLTSSSKAGVSSIRSSALPVSTSESKARTVVQTYPVINPAGASSKASPTVRSTSIRSPISSVSKATPKIQTYAARNKSSSTSLKTTQNAYPAIVVTSKASTTTTAARSKSMSQIMYPTNTVGAQVSSIGSTTTIVSTSTVVASSLPVSGRVPRRGGFRRQHRKVTQCPAPLPDAWIKANFKSSSVDGRALLNEALSVCQTVVEKVKAGVAIPPVPQAPSSNPVTQPDMTPGSPSENEKPGITLNPLESVSPSTTTTTTSLADPARPTDITSILSSPITSGTLLPTATYVYPTTENPILPSSAFEGSTSSSLMTPIAIMCFFVLIM